MHYHYRLILPFLPVFSLLLAINVHGQTTVKFSEEEIVRIGLEQNVRIRIADAQSDEVRHAYRQVRASQLPAIRSQASYTRISDNVPEVEFSIPGIDTTFTFLPVELNRFYSEVTVEQPLFAGFRIRNSIRAAASEAEAALLMGEQEQSDVAFAIRRAYWNLYQAIAILESVDAALSQVSEHLRDVQNRVDAGTALTSDYLNARSRRSEVLLEQIEANSAVRIAQLELNRLAGLPLDTDIRPSHGDHGEHGEQGYQGGQDDSVDVSNFGDTGDTVDFNDSGDSGEWGESSESSESGESNNPGDSGNFDPGDIIVYGVSYDSGNSRAFKTFGESGKSANFGPHPANPSPIVEKALANRPQIRAMQKQIDGLGSQVSMAGGNWFPELYLTGRYIYARPNQYFFLEQDRFRASWEVGLTLRWSIFEGGSRIAQTSRARARLRIAEERLADSREQVSVEAARQHLELERASEAIQVAGQNIEGTEEALRMARTQYEEGVALSSHVLDAEAAHRAAITRHVRAIAEYAIARAALLNIQGQVW